MNDDAFEKKLESLAGALPRPDPTPPWKAEILARARREAATTTAPSRRIMPPRWLVTVWCTAWALIVFMHFTTPVERAASPSAWTASASPGSGDLGAAVAAGRRTTPDPLTLLAFHREMNVTYNTP